MYSFKEWLVNKGEVIQEAGFGDAGSDWFFGSYLYPSDAWDWPYVINYPADFYYLQSRWKQDQEQGRKFYGIDLPKVLKTKFTSIYSNTMPGEGGGFWEHRPDNRPNLTIDNDAQMQCMAHGKNHKKPQVIYTSNDLLDQKKKLNKLFGKFEPKYYELPDDFDEPWVNKSK